MNATAPAPWSPANSRARQGWSATRLMSWGFTVLATGFVAMLVVLFIGQSIPAWRHEGFQLLTGRKWFYRQEQFGALPMIYGTVIVSLLALLLAAPIGIGAAIFSAEFVPRRL